MTTPFDLMLSLRISFVAIARGEPTVLDIAVAVSFSPFTLSDDV